VIQIKDQQGNFIKKLASYQLFMRLIFPIPAQKRLTDILAFKLNCVMNKKLSTSQKFYTRFFLLVFSWCLEIFKEPNDGETTWLSRFTIRQRGLIRSLSGFAITITFLLLLSFMNDAILTLSLKSWVSKELEFLVTLFFFPGLVNGIILIVWGSYGWFWGRLWGEEKPNKLTQHAHLLISTPVICFIILMLSTVEYTKIQKKVLIFFYFDFKKIEASITNIHLMADRCRAMPSYSEQWIICECQLPIDLAKEVKKIDTIIKSHPSLQNFEVTIPIPGKDFESVLYDFRSLDRFRSWQVDFLLQERCHSNSK